LRDPHRCATLALAMRALFIISIACVCAGIQWSCASTQRFAKKEVLVEFRLMKKGGYCGGARPSDQMLLDIEKNSPLASTQFYIKAGHTNDPSAPAIYSSITDEEGLAFVNLKAGDYLLVFDEKQDWSQYMRWKEEFATAKPPYGAMDTLCLRNWIQTPEAVFQVHADSSHVVEIVRTDKCFWNNIPCLEYLGSIPP
jgi:hypothetical protein